MYQLNLDSPKATDASNTSNDVPQRDTHSAQIQTASKFYVVSIKKFYALFFGTLGTYIVYWFYRHWQTAR